MSRHFDAEVQPALSCSTSWGGEHRQQHRHGHRPWGNLILENPESTPLNSLAVWQPGEDVNDLGDAVDQSMEPMVGGDYEGEVDDMELEISGPLVDYLQEVERDFNGGGLEFVFEEENDDEVADDTEPESEGDELGWRALECLGKLAIICCGDCGLLQSRHPHQVPTENPKRSLWLWGGDELHASDGGRYAGFGGSDTDFLPLL